MHDGAQDADLRPLAAGEFVIVRRPRASHFGVPARGPFVVQAQDHRAVRMVDLASGRVLVESRSNCLPVNLGLEEVITGAPEDHDS